MISPLRERAFGKNRVSPDRQKAAIAACVEISIYCETLIGFGSITTECG